MEYLGFLIKKANAVGCIGSRKLIEMTMCVTYLLSVYCCIFLLLQVKLFCYLWKYFSARR